MGFDVTEIGRPKMGMKKQFEALVSLSDVSPSAQKHLLRVYGDLSMCILAASIGAIFASKLVLNEMLGLRVVLGIASVVQIVSLLAVRFMSSSDQNKRLAVFLTFGFASGMGVGPLVGVLMETNPGVVAMALFLTLFIFAGFSLTALFSDKRLFVLVGGFLSSALLVLLIGGLFSFKIQLYFGLVVFCAFVVYDTQIIIYKHNVLGSDDHLSHAVDLFIDIFAIFVRILIILVKNQAQKEKGDGNKKKRNSRR